MYRQIFQKNKNSKNEQTNFLKNRKSQKVCRPILQKIQNYEKHIDKFIKKLKIYEN